MVKVTVSGVTKEYETGITYGEVSKDFKDNCKYDIILAKQGAKLIELNKKIKTDCEIEFLDISDPNGSQNICQRRKSAVAGCFLLKCVRICRSKMYL